MKKSKKKMPVRLFVSVITVILLTFSLIGVTLALFYTTVELQATAETSTVRINLNDGEAIIDATDPEETFKFFEPGMTVVKECFVENVGNEDAYYRIYMENITGTLATVLEITVMDGNKELYSGTIANMTPDKVAGAGTLAVDERHDLTVTFHYPEHAGNLTMNTKLTFNLCAEAIQQRNNNPLNPFHVNME